jgi:hypothetical protein
MYLGLTSSPEKKFLEKRQNPNFSSADELTSELYAKGEAVVCLVSARFLIKLFAISVAVVGFASQFWWGSFRRRQLHRLHVHVKANAILLANRKQLLRFRAP